jgi:hypothetical protein
LISDASAAPRGAGRSALAVTASAGSSTRSLRLLDPALTTRTRPAAGLALFHCGHAQLVISVRESGCSSVIATWFMAAFQRLVVADPLILRV